MFPGDGAYIASADEVAQRLASHKLEQVLLNAPAGDWGKGERGLGGFFLVWLTALTGACAAACHVAATSLHVAATLPVLSLCPSLRPSLHSSLL